MTHDVFISHSTQDKQIALAICARLEADRIRCWIAPRDVPPGESWPAAIMGAIEQCKVMVLVLSSASNASNDVAREVVSAAKAGKTIVPFKIDDVIPKKELDYFLKSVHWLDAVTPPLAAHLEALTLRLAAALDLGTNSASAGSPDRTLPPTTKDRAGSNAGAPSNRGGHLRTTAIAVAMTAAAALGAYALLATPDAPPKSVESPDATSGPLPSGTDTQSRPSQAVTIGQRFSDRMKDGTSGPALVVVPGGSYLMGAVAHDTQAQPNEKPAIRVDVAPLAVGVYEVTRSEFERFLDDSGKAFRNVGGCAAIVEKDGKRDWQGDPALTVLNNPYAVSDQHPVVCTSWQAAQAFTAWLSTETGHRYRLPTEAEQEYFIRAGSSTIFPWGDTFAPDGCEYVNGQRTAESHPGTPCTNDAFGYQLRPVGSLKLNAFGLYDTIGNAGEFSSSCNRATPGAQADCAYRLVRGGSANDGIVGLRASALQVTTENFVGPTFGFRVVRELSSAEISDLGAQPTSEPTSMSMAPNEDATARSTTGEPLASQSLDNAQKAIAFTEATIQLESVMQAVRAAVVARDNAARAGDHAAYGRAANTITMSTVEGIRLLDSLESNATHDQLRLLAPRRIELLIIDGWTHANGTLTDKAYGIDRFLTAVAYSRNAWVDDHNRRWANFELARTITTSPSNDALEALAFTERTIDGAPMDWVRLHSRIVLGTYALRVKRDIPEASKQLQRALAEAHIVDTTPSLAAQSAHAADVTRQAQQLIDEIERIRG